MVTTFADLISETEDHLLSGGREELNQLKASMTASDTAMNVTYDMGGIQQGAYVNVDLEVMYVWSTADDSNQATVQRGMLGSVPAAHSNGAIIYVNPRFSKWAIAKGINAEIRDLSSPPNGLFRIKDFMLTTFPSRRSYPIPAANAGDLLDVIEVRYSIPGPEKTWPRVENRDYQLIRHAPITEFPDGLGLRLDVGTYPGRPMRVVYGAPFTELANLTDDAATVSGLPPTALDIPPLGAAARLMGVREAKRTFTESAVDTRRASEVPAGSAARSAQALILLMNERIRTEYIRLVSQYPDAR